MKRNAFLLSLLFLLFIVNGIGQDTVIHKTDSSVIEKLRTQAADLNIIRNAPANNKRIKWVTGGNIVAYSGISSVLYNTWYKHYPQTHFHFFNDNKEWLQVDKVGHAYSAYLESRMSLEMWRWAGVPRKERIWIGGLSGAAYQSIIEVLDGFSEGWGWSWGDFTGNVLGSGMLIAQEFAWNEQKLQLKFSFHRKTYTDPVLKERADQLFGSSTGSRLLKDYNGQTYWLSGNLSSLFKKASLPKWLNAAIGYGAEGMFDADENVWKDKNGLITNATHIKRYRQFYFSPDIDLTKIRTKSRPLKMILFVLNAFKFPAPALELSNNKVRFHFIQF